MMTLMKLLIHPPVDDTRLAKIRQAAAPAMEVVNAKTSDEALAHMPGADAFFGKMTPVLLTASRQLRWVQSPTASLEHYLFPELIEHPCKLTNMRGLYSDVIAEHVFGVILCFAKNLHIYIRQQAQSKWAPVGGEETRASFSSGPGEITAIDRAHQNLFDTTLGIVGLGEIGTEIGWRGLDFRMRVLAVDPIRKTSPSEGMTLWNLDRLPDLLAESDYLVIAAPHTPQTVKMFRREQFKRMKRTAYLINIGRGAIVDLDDLTESLRNKEIAGAALDVFETEPLPAVHALWKMENAILTPHVAGYSAAIPERHLTVLLDNVGRFARGETLRNLVDKTRWF
jgi:phosphoglycerate dehydrogenase-like enzyme